MNGIKERLYVLVSFYSVGRDGAFLARRGWSTHGWDQAERQVTKARAFVKRNGTRRVQSGLFGVA